MKLLVAIPALNEENSIVDVIEQVKNFLPLATVLVIDDGSTDKTSHLAKVAGAKVLSMPFNVGVGGALRSAFRYAKEFKFTHVMQIDADGQHLPSESINLLENSFSSGVLIGSRFLGSASEYRVSFARKLAMIILSKATSKICKTKLTDVTSGFRISSGAAIDLFAKEYPTDYLGDTVESLIIAKKAGLEIGEIPVSMNYRQHGSPSQNTIKSIWYLIRTNLVIVLSIIRK